MAFLPPIKRSGFPRQKMIMKFSPEEVLQYIKEEDIKFIRMGFCDVYGKHKNVAIQADELPRAFAHGVVIDASAVYDGISSDLLLHPNASTLTQLPWRPRHGGVAHMFCDITNPDGSPFEADTRRILRMTVDKAQSLGYSFDFSSRMEFYLMKLNERGEAVKMPYDYAGYMDVAPEDKGENIRREICLTLEKMGIQPERSHHERGPGQNEIDFRSANPITAADNAVMFYTMVKTVAGQNGLWADFSPQPFGNEAGSGMHIVISTNSNDSNVLSHMMAGLLAKIRDITIFLNPCKNSYERLNRLQFLIGCSKENRSFLLRIPTLAGKPKRVELRSPDSMCNPYLAFALIIHAALYGLQEKLSLPPTPPALDPSSISKETSAAYAKLPVSMREAAQIASNSTFIKNCLPTSVIRAYCEKKC